MKNIVIGILLVLLGVIMYRSFELQRAPAGSGSVDQEQRRTTRAMVDSLLQPSVYAKRIANIRRRPSSDGAVIAKTIPGQKLRYVAKRGQWFELTTSDSSRSRWIHESAVRTEQEQRARESAELRVDGWSWHEEYGYAIAEGRVTNVSSARLENVQAVITFETASGEFITSDDALIEFDPLLPGQSSPWKVTTRWNPAMSNASLQFKQLSGGMLSAYRD